jgi:FtsH-binding integral membrane protein
MRDRHLTSTDRPPSGGDPGATPSVPTALALLCWALAGVFSLCAAVLGTSSLQEGFEGVRPMVAAGAGGFVLLATRFILATVAWLRDRRRAEWSRPIARSIVAVIAGSSLLVAAYIFLAAASDSWAEAVAATLGLWLGLMALAALGERLCWLVAGAGCVALFLASVAVSIWDGG